VTPHASVLRVDGTLHPHHHLVCSRCKAVQDIEGDFVDFKRLARQLPGGFDLSQPLIEVFGLCGDCGRSRSTAIPKPGFSTKKPVSSTKKKEK
jgi:Fur family transcriptional regulator, peroxide stress response regulator